MRYCVSDIHGEYELFSKLLKRINFSNDDEMFICGDIIEKGDKSVELARYISSFSNIHCIIGNHEYAFLKYYQSLLQKSPDDFDEVLRKLQIYLLGDGARLDWDLVDWLECLPYYIEREDFICVHAGVPVLQNGELMDLAKASEEELVYDRTFKEARIKHSSEKCVFFGHTPTFVMCGESKILGYLRAPNSPPKNVADFYKIHLDTGSHARGVLGCFCIDTLKAIYVKKDS